MQRLLTGIIVAVITLAAGIAANMLWNSSRESPMSAAYPNSPPTPVVSETVTETTTVTSPESATPSVEAERVSSSKTIRGGVLNGKAISKPQPVYPPIAKAARASGMVVVDIVVDETGEVISAHATSGHPLLQEAAVAAARQARFSPTRLSGKPVKVSGAITYNFVLQ